MISGSCHEAATYVTPEVFLLEDVDSIAVIPLDEIMPYIRNANAIYHWHKRELDKHARIVYEQYAENQATRAALSECQQQKIMYQETNAQQNIKIASQAGIIRQQSNMIKILGTIAATAIAYTTYQTLR